MDHFRLEPASARADAGECRQVAIVINGVPLLELVRAVELPLLAAEREIAIAAGASEGEAAPPPASYMYPTVGLITRDAEEFFGPIASMFRLEPDDPHHGKTCVLGCDCGDPGCWPLVVRITRKASLIGWSEFSQFHREWGYGLGPYEFNAGAYDQEFQRISAAVKQRVAPDTGVGRSSLDRRG